jgi:uncharacterized membrane protein YhhN
MISLSSQEGKRRTGEYLMLAGFLAVVGQLLLYNTLLAVAGFVSFLVGAELYIRNRKHWSEV